MSNDFKIQGNKYYKIKRLAKIDKRVVKTVRGEFDNI